jgi:hypothetical protein
MPNLGIFAAALLLLEIKWQIMLYMYCSPSITHKEELYDTEGAIISVYRRTDNTMTKRKSTKGQTTIYKIYTST